MAQIIGLKEKQLALAEINGKLNSLKQINEFLTANNPSGKYTISFDNKHRISLFCHDGEAINAIVRAYKEQLVAEIRAEAQKYSIGFEDEDEALMQ